MAGENDTAARGAQGFKGQPWVLYDTVAAFSFLAGDTSDDGVAIGSQTPAINAKGEMVFFQDRTRQSVGEPYTNLDIKGQLSYGMEVWGVYLQVMLPFGFIQTGADGPTLLQMAKLAEILLHGSALLVDLGQEEQSAFHSLRFGAGGGIAASGIGGGAGGGVGIGGFNNGIAYRRHMMVYPEPIEMPRTQNFSCKLTLSPEALATLGTAATPGIGVALPALAFSTLPFGEPTAVDISVRELPYMVQLGLVGRRVKKTQYGQLGPRRRRRAAR